VRMHWSCRDAESGAVLECSRDGGAIVATAPGAASGSGDPSEKGEPLTFEVGAGDTQNNPIFEAFDAAVRGLAVGERAEIEAEGGAWDPSRLFVVPRAHDEVQRLEGRYKK
jgi:FKBP-type peptidyl-prolyl cis-trans isomerase 2